jgi:outer membrane protein OmpA-like peptidoglycan-associated protein
MRRRLLSVLFILIGYTVSAQQETTVHFAFDKDELTSDARLALDTVAANNKITSIAIYGHCDQLGSKEYNYNLSERRANAVKAYLVSKGFNEESITTIKGYGEDQPVINKLDALSRKANRRVTIVIVALQSLVLMKLLLQTLLPHL